MIEACDRLGEKLDQLASLAQALAQAWPQDRGPSGASPGARAPADGAVARAPAVSGAPGAEEAPRDRRPGPGPETGHSQQEHSAAPPAPAANGGAPDAGTDPRHLVDTLARSQGAWPEQAADLREALEAVMAFLEKQAASAPPRLDLSDILGRLQNLEEQQKNLQSQISLNR